MDGQCTKGVETLPKISTSWVRHTSITDRRRTSDTIYRKFTKK